MIWGYHTRWTSEGGNSFVSHAFQGEVPKDQHWEYVDITAKSTTALCGIKAGQGWYGHRQPYHSANVCKACENALKRVEQEKPVIPTRFERV